YYAALFVAWKAGVRGVGLVAAAALGICGCGGIPILAGAWNKVESATYAAISEGDETSFAVGAFSKFRVFALVAIAGMAMQIIGGYALPDDDGDDYAYADGYDSYDSYDDADEEGASDDAYGGLGSDREMDPDPASDSDSESDSDSDSDSESDSESDSDSDAESESDSDSDYSDSASDSELESVDDAFDEVVGLVIAISRDRRYALLLPTGASRARWVGRARGRWAGIAPWSLVEVTVHIDEATWIARAVRRTDGVALDRLPRPTVLRDALDRHEGEMLVLPMVRSDDGRSVTLGDGTRLGVSGPRRALTRDTDYTAVRGFLVGTPPDGRAPYSFAIPRPTDVIE
ncbi:MAG: hypothetical protein AB7P00_38230, partial [Sandaracinaceae bacterium]